MNQKLTPTTFEKLKEWYGKNKRDLPFRKTKDPYKILISEIMSHQTQIDTLLPYYERFINRFPTIEDLAKSSLDEVFRYWEGLGYYNRAKNLLKAAKIIVENGFPNTYEELIKLPGVGPYTAGAVSSICFDEKKASVDGNTLRVLARLLALDLDITKTKTKKIITQKIEENMSSEPAVINQAIIDLANGICTPKNPKCFICPVRDDCLGFDKGLTSLLPVKATGQKKKTVYNEALIILKDEDILFEKRQNSNLLSDTYGLPIKDKKKIDGEAVEDLAKKYEVTKPILIGSSIHQFSHLQWNTDVYFSKATEQSKTTDLYFNPSVVPTAFKRMIDVYKKSQKLAKNRKIL